MSLPQRRGIAASTASSERPSRSATQAPKAHNEKRTNQDNQTRKDGGSAFAPVRAGLFASKRSSDPPFSENKNSSKDRLVAS